MKVLWLSSIAAITMAFPAVAQEKITTPILPSVDNFRDLAGISAEHGGTGLANTVVHDGVMRTGVYYRSNALTLSDPDLTTISGLGLTKVIDLRTHGEVDEAPDVVPTGAQYMHIDILGDGNDQMSFLQNVRTPAQAVAAMENLNRNFVTDSVNRAGYRETLLELAHTPGALLYHCTSGKDRTGWVSAILQTIAGVSDETIMQDYLATNSYSNTMGRLEGMPASVVALYAPLLGVQASYLEAAFDQVDQSYGSMHNYLTQGLGLTQADIYVLRARMVYYRSLPGQDTFVGNAAQGAGLLNALQNSTLSGDYTQFNYWFQSAIDAGTLGGMQNKVGGQIHADAASTLLREPQRINRAISSYVVGHDLADKQTAIWQANLAQSSHTRASDNATRSKTSNMGLLIGVTHRASANASFYAGFGHNWAEITNPRITARAKVNSFIGTLGARYAFSDLDQGPFIALSGTAESARYRSSRFLTSDLGTSTGRTHGYILGGSAKIGDIIKSGSLDIIPQIGVNVAYLHLQKFQETNSELALGVASLSETKTSLEAQLKIQRAAKATQGWALQPSLELGYLRQLNHPATTINASIAGFEVSQRSAFNSRNIGRASLGLSATKGPVRVEVALDGELGDNQRTSNYGGHIAASYRF